MPDFPSNTPNPTIPAVPGATPAWMTLVGTLIAAGAQVATAVATANAQHGTNIQLPPNYTLNVPPVSPNAPPAPSPEPAKSASDISTTTIIIIVVAVLVVICGVGFFLYKSKKTV